MLEKAVPDTGPSRGGDEGGERADQGDDAERAVTVFLVEKRIDDHDYHAEDGEDELGKNAHVVGERRRLEGLHLGQQSGEPLETVGRRWWS